MYRSLHRLVSWFSECRPDIVPTWSAAFVLSIRALLISDAINDSDLAAHFGITFGGLRRWSSEFATAVTLVSLPISIILQDHGVTDKLKTGIIEPQVLASFDTHIRRVGGVFVCECREVSVQSIIAIYQSAGTFMEGETYPCNSRKSANPDLTELLLRLAPSRGCGLLGRQRRGRQGPARR